MKTAQNVSYEEIEPEPMDDPGAESRSRRRSTTGLFVLAMLLSGVAAGLGIYAWVLVNEKQQLKSDVAKLEQVRDEAEVRVAQLVEQNGQEQARTAQADSEREQLRAALAAANAELEQLQVASQATREQIAEYEALRAKFQRMIDSGALDINIRRGRMIVEMPAAVLFDSGSAELSDAGKETVIQVAKILRNVPKHRFLVGGHTDNVPAVRQYKSNWELSAARAVRVTETLTSHGVSSKRLVIAGYSEYDPVATNGSEAGRRKNRRIEIILEPYVEPKLVKDLLEAKNAAAAAKSPGSAPAKTASAADTKK